MSQVLVNDTHLQDIADAIREKTGGSDTFKPSEMADAIGEIAGGIVEESSSSNMDTYLTTKPIDSIYEFTGTSTSDYINGRLYRIVYPDYLCFTANTAGSTVAMSVTGTPTLGQNFSYSTNKSTWNTFTPGTTTITLTNAGDKVYFKGNNPNGVNEYDEETMTGTTVYKFIFTGSIAASGNIMSLIDNGSCNILTIPNAGCFCNMFQGCTALTAAPELPATTLTEGCYYEMFDGCTSLTTAPALPATTLEDYCYIEMFRYCSSLIVTPALPATTLADCCYYDMFNGCTNLTTAPALPATTLTDSCYSYMFYGCTSLTTAPALPATTLADSCYDSMFRGCTSLQVNDTSVSGTAEQVWTIPSSGTFTSTFAQSSMFTICAGTRSSNNMAGASGASYTYYTQNTPV